MLFKVFCLLVNPTTMGHHERAKDAGFPKVVAAVSVKTKSRFSFKVSFFADGKQFQKMFA